MNAAEPTEAPLGPASSAVVIELIDVPIAGADAVEPGPAEGIYCRIAAGDYWVVGGPPGSGKSDLLATMAGLYRPLKGTLRLFGQNVAKLSDDELLAARLRIGLVFENGGRLFNQLTVAENVALPLRYHRDGHSASTEERLHRILAATGLGALAGQAPGEIKHAWRQRVGLARALAMGPEVLLLDNPLTGLGPPEARWWLEFLAALMAGHEVMEGLPVTLAIATHDLRPWTNQGRQFALLNQKRWVPIGGRGELACSDEPLLRELLAADDSIRAVSGGAS